MGKKSPMRKSRLAKKTRQNRKIPTFVMIRTKRDVVSNTKQRVWRTQKINKKDKD